MRPYREHLLSSSATIREALKSLDALAKDAIVFIVDDTDRLLGSLTDGDVRRGLIRGVGIEQSVDSVFQKNPKFIRKGDRDIHKIIALREGNVGILPVLDNENKVVSLVNFGEQKSYLPIDAVVMAGGKGMRLRPLTENVPKPLLKVGEKPILKHNMDRLISYGVDDFWISVNYLGEEIEKYFGSGSNENIRIEYVWEKNPLGTVGSVSNISNFVHDYVLLTNSDILTNMDYEDFFLRFLEEDADFAVVTIPYKVDIPYAVLETKNGKIVNFKEKPTYTYYSNGGIYLMKRDVIDLIPKNSFFNTTDLMELLISKKMKVISYPLSGYWLDIGRMEDFEKANNDIKHLKILQ